MPHNAADPALRAAVENELRTPHSPPRSRAAIARHHGISTRTVSRWADELGLTDPFTTRDIRAATAAATDRRRALRSDLADQLLGVDVPALRARMANADRWRQALVVPAGGGASEVHYAAENDATVAKGLKDLHAAVGTAIDKSIAIDRHDVQAEGDTAASDVLARLFDGLGTAYRVLDQAANDEGGTL